MLKKDKEKQSRKRRKREEETFPIGAFVLCAILLVIMFYSCTRLDNYDGYTAIGESGIAAPVCDIKSPTIFLNPATSKDGTIFNTTYKVIFDGQYFGEFDGARNTTFINATAGPHIEFIASSKDCFTYSAYQTFHVPCQSIVYVTPELECEKEHGFYLIDLDKYKAVSDGDGLITRGDTIHLKFEETYPYSDRRQHFACNYDPFVIDKIQTTPEFPKNYIRTDNFIGEASDITSADEFTFNIELRPSSGPVKTKVICYLIDEDFIYEDKQFKMTTSTKDLKDVGMKNPSITFYIKRQ
jgi:hypothetical protein